ncbi:MAG: GT2 family glycosyltransferase [Planctomycetota bacterium]|jgi:GT2 family glycosyltransferase
MSPSLGLNGVWAVVVNWNGGQHNLRCLRAAAAAGIAPERTLLVDNGSGDGSAELVADQFPTVNILRNPSNLGFGEGANRGARQALEAGAGAVLFLNNDLELDAAAAAQLVEELNAHPRTGACGPRVLHPGEPTRVWAAGGRIDNRQNISTLLGFGQADGVPWTERREVDYVVGAALCVRAVALAQVGLFRADYFAYMEDVELGLRLKQAGWACVSVGSARAIHHPSASTGGGYNGRRKYMQALNSVRFLRQYGGTREWLRFWWFDVASLGPALVLGGLRGRGRAVLAKALGLWHGLNGRRVRAELLEPGGLWLW